MINDTVKICKTKYPILLVHGAGVRDDFIGNYWGRIPQMLIDNGATVYYGGQDAWSEISKSAEIIKERIDEVNKETGAGKVNIIAHSKGGLDARYLISTLKYDKYVASLTTISTPHSGSRLLDKITSAPHFLYKPVSFIVNHAYRLMGDKNPNFYNAIRQLSSRCCTIFNEKNVNSPEVFYQSFGSRMKSPFDDQVYILLNTIIRFYDGDNDGLVPFESSKWDNFSEIRAGDERKGLSHVDVIDLRKRDRWGFDVRGFYKDIVIKLKNLGY